MVVPVPSPPRTGWTPRQWRRVFAVLLLAGWVGFRLWTLVRQNQPRPELAPPSPANPASETARPTGADPSGPAAVPHASTFNDIDSDPPGTEPPASPAPGTDAGGSAREIAGRGNPPPPPPKPGLPGRTTGTSPPPNTGRATPGRPVEPPPAPAVTDPLAGPARPLPRGETQVVRVRRVIDGDTLLLQDGTRVRMIGVDTPETKMEGAEVQPFGPEASEFVKQAVARGPVSLVFDGESEDNYGRILAHVCVNDRFIGEDLIRLGLARALYRHPYSNEVKDRFRAAENAAKREKRGIWSLAEPPSHPAPAREAGRPGPGNPPRGESSRPPAPQPNRSPAPGSPQPGSRNPTPAGSRDF
ncbi:MAG: thermonuclease family protein [Planctomycetaceae bacterium]